MFEFDIFQQLLENYEELARAEATDEQVDYMLDDGSVVEVTP